MSRGDWGWMLALCCTAILGHWLLIRAYAVAEASAIQPFAYLQLVFVSLLGITLFGEVLRTNVMIGAGLVVAAGIFTLWRQHVRARTDARSSSSS
jgi:drug/metabolite transporter (DMT)-like permease